MCPLWTNTQTQNIRPFINNLKAYLDTSPKIYNTISDEFPLLIQEKNEFGNHRIRWVTILMTQSVF